VFFAEYAPILMSFNYLFFKKLVQKKIHCFYFSSILWVFVHGKRIIYLYA